MYSKIVLALALLVPVLASSRPAMADTSELIGSLVNLGVTEKQATGGAGALFEQAKNSLSAADYATVSKALPGVDDLRKAAPKVEAAGRLGGLTSALGGANKAAQAANLVNQFKQLGLGADMVQKFIPPLLEYATAKGGSAVMKLLQGALM